MVSLKQLNQDAGKLHPSRRSSQAYPSRSRRMSAAPRRFESESSAIQSLQLVAAVDPSDDLAGEQVVYGFKVPEHSKDLIVHLIDFIKSL